jgi:hypothetical protein
LLYQYALNEKKSIVQSGTFLYALLASLTSYADKELNLKCNLFKDYLSINDPLSTEKFPSRVIDFPPTMGFIYNSMKMRIGFINRLKLIKEEMKIAESQMKGKKGKPGVQDDPNYSSLSVHLRVLHTHYMENSYLVKLALTEFIRDEEYLKRMIGNNILQSYR